MRTRLLVGAGAALLVAIVIIWRLQARDAQGSAHPSASRGSRIGKTMPRTPVTPATLSGRVTRASDGAPVAQAVVAIAAETHALDVGTAAVVVASDTDGRWSTTGVAPGAMTLTVTAVGFVPHTRELVVADGGARSDLDVALDAGGVLVSGAITTEQQQPIANARVRAYRDNMGPSFLALSGPDGRYQVHLTSGEYQLEVTHGDYRPAWKNIMAGDERVTADIVLVRGGVIRGVVVARDTGQPVVDAHLDAHGEGVASSAVAGSDGTFTLRALRDGTITIHARGRGFASATPTTVELEPAGEVRDVRVLVDPAGTIVGRVVAKEEPTRGIGGAGVRSMPLDGGSWPALAVTDPDGYFELFGLRPGSHWLSADRRGQLFQDGVQVEVVGTEIADVLIEMRTAATIAGRVEPPVAVAQVALSIPGGDLLATGETDAVSIARARAETDASGAFTLGDVPAGEFEVTAMAKDGRSGTVTVAMTGTNRTGVVIPLSSRASVSGRVLDEHGRAVAGAHVGSHRVDAPLATRMKHDGIRRYARTASDGSFRLVGLDAGTWQIAVEGGSVEVELAAGEARTGVTITARSRDQQIRGTVVGPDRTPVRGAQVHAMREKQTGSGRFDFQSDPARTDAAGSFVIDGLWPGSYTLVAEGPRAAAKATVSGVAAGASVTITLEPTTTLTVVIVTRAGVGAAARDVSVVCGRADPLDEVHEQVNGSHTFTNVAQGTYRCEAHSDDGSASGSVTVRSEPATLTLTLEDHATLTGVAIAALTGQPVAGMSVMTRGAAAETDATGRFVLERVRAGASELRLRPAHLVYPGFDRHLYTAKPGERVDVGRVPVVPPRIGAAGTFGLTLEVRADTDTLVVVKVKPGSPADRAGIASGDTITSVDGHAVTTLGPDRARRLLATEAVASGQTVTLHLGRGARVAVTAVTW